LIFLDGLYELRPVEFHRKDDFYKPSTPRQPPQHSLGDVVPEPAVWSEAVDEHAHFDVLHFDGKSSIPSIFKNRILIGRNN
jgi:hypothetical protein